MFSKSDYDSHPNTLLNQKPLQSAPWVDNNRPPQPSSLDHRLTGTHR